MKIGPEAVGNDLLEELLAFEEILKIPMPECRVNCDGAPRCYAYHWSPVDDRCSLYSAESSPDQLLTSKRGGARPNGACYQRIFGSSSLVTRRLDENYQGGCFQLRWPTRSGACDALLPTGTEWDPNSAFSGILVPFCPTG